MIFNNHNKLTEYNGDLNQVKITNNTKARKRLLVSWLVNIHWFFVKQNIRICLTYDDSLLVRAELDGVIIFYFPGNDFS